MLKRSFSIIFDVLWSWDHVLFIFWVLNFADVDLLVRFRKGPSPRHHHWECEYCRTCHLSNQVPVQYVLCKFVVCFMFRGWHGTVCVFVLDRSLPRDILTKFILSVFTGWFGIVWTSSGPTSGKLNQLTDISFGMIDQFRVWSPVVVRWPMGIR